MNLRICSQPEGYCEAGTLIVVGSCVVMFGQQIVVEENGVEGVLAEDLTGFIDVVCNCKEVAFEAFSKPTVPLLVVVQKENADGMSLRFFLIETEFV